MEKPPWRFLSVRGVYLNTRPTAVFSLAILFIPLLFINSTISIKTTGDASNDKSDSFFKTLPPSSSTVQKLRTRRQFFLPLCCLGKHI